MKYRKRPVVIEAVQWRGDNTEEMLSFLQASSGVDGRLLTDPASWLPWPHAADGLFRINTLEGAMLVNVGDWVIRGVQNELYPCKPDIFVATYEPVTGP